MASSGLAALIWSCPSTPLCPMPTSLINSFAIWGRVRRFNDLHRARRQSCCPVPGICVCMHVCVFEPIWHKANSCIPPKFLIFVHQNKLVKQGRIVSRCKRVMKNVLGSFNAGGCCKGPSKLDNKLQACRKRFKGELCNYDMVQPCKKTVHIVQQAAK
eukprot:191125-Pelagomonas_calceolata.AAC.2